MKLVSDDQPEAFDLRHVDDDSDSDDSAGEFYKPSTDMPALAHDQEIGEFDALVLVQKRNWKGGATPQKKYSFMYDNYIQAAKSKTRLLYVIIHCIPIPILLKASLSNCLIIPVNMKLTDPVKALFKHLTLYL